MSRRVVFGGALVALVLLAGPLSARDQPLTGWFDLTVPGGETTLIALGMTLEERAFTLPMLARTLHDRNQHARLSATLAQLVGNAGEGSPEVSVPAPLDAATWQDILPPVKPPAPRDLFVRLISDRSALLTAYGLTTTNDRVRAFLMRDRNLLRAIYTEGAAAFALVGRSLDIDAGRVLVPGGTEADAAWRALVGEPPTRPSQFIRALVTRDAGRLAWYFDTLSGLDADRRSAAWAGTEPLERRLSSLYSSFRDPDHQWRVTEQPFRRTPIDAWMIVTQTEVANGAATSPLPRATWELLFANARVSRDQVARTLREPRDAVSLPWLVRETLSPLVRERRARYEMFRLAQRVFADAPAATLPDVAFALSGLRQFRALLFTLERMGIKDPGTWAAAVDAAQHVGNNANDRRLSIVSFQATLALVERLRHTRSIDRDTTDHLIRSLSDAVRTDSRVIRSLAHWIVERLAPALPRVEAALFEDQTYESLVLDALAGPPDRNAPAVEWEGLTYVADHVAAERDRLHAMRAMLPSPGLDRALNSLRAQDLSEALTAIVYATALGDPDGPAALSPDVVLRHEFGLAATAMLREELPWSPPEERQGTGPWHVQGSLLGLDLALSRLFLRRIADQQMPQAPSLTLNDLGTLTRTAVALVPFDLKDADRDEIAAAIARGRERVLKAGSVAELMDLAAECGMAASTRELLPWVLKNQRESVQEAFALRDLFWLGRPQLSREVLDGWGVAADGIDGRRILAMPGPVSWENFAGRSEVGQVTTQVPDVTLRLIEETSSLRLPARLIPSLLAFALEDYWHDVRARFVDDWPRLTRQAAALTSTRIHDYVAALAGGGPLRPH